MNIKMTLWLFLLVVTSSTNFGFAKTLTKLEYDQMRQIKDGEYLSFAYINSLSKYSSPEIAFKSGRPQMIAVSRKQDQIILKIIYNFHEAGNLFAIDKYRVISAKFSGGVDDSNIVIEASGNGIIKFGVGKYKAMNFIYVGDVKKYVASKVLVGKYKDEHNDCYFFSNDGWALFPSNNIFEYEVGLDHIEIQYDYFRDKTNNMIYAYKWQNGVLMIFATEGDESEIVHQKPTFIIKKME